MYKNSHVLPCIAMKTAVQNNIAVIRDYPFVFSP